MKSFPKPSSLPDDQPDILSIILPEYQETLRATWAICNLHGTEPAFRLLVHELPHGQDFDAPVSEHARGWHATPTRRFERLLRETRVGLGLLSNGDALRLLYAPPGENPGSLEFKVTNDRCGKPSRKIFPARPRLTSVSARAGAAWINADRSQNLTTTCSPGR